MVADLTGRRFLVVGASSGIGRAVAEGAVAGGAQVVASARRADQLTEIEGAVALPGDVCDEASCRQVVADAAEAMGGIDALVYAVGMSPLKPMADATQEDWRSVFDTNVIGAALVATAAIPHLLESQGRAMFLSSKAVRRPFPNLGLYTTSKFALDGLIECIRAEYPGLDVTRALIGNTIGTDFAAIWDPAELERAVEAWAASGVLGSAGMMHPTGVAEAILAVLSTRVLIDDLAIIDRDGDDGSA